MMDRWTDGRKDGRKTKWMEGWMDCKLLLLTNYTVGKAALSTIKVQNKLQALDA